MSVEQILTQKPYALGLQLCEKLKADIKTLTNCDTMMTVTPHKEKAASRILTDAEKD